MTMAGPISKKRNHQDSGSKPKSQRPNKKQRKQFQYHSDSDSEEASNSNFIPDNVLDPDNPNFIPINLRDSDNEDLDNVAVDDVPSGDSASSDSEIDQKAAKAAIRNKKRKTQKPPPPPPQQQQQPAKDAPSSPASASEPEEEQNDSNNDGSSSSSSSSEEEEEGGDEYSDDDDDDDDDDDNDEITTRKNGSNSNSSKSKRNDPSAFATSISKILSTKLATSRRADPVLARSADAQQAAREVVDSALEAKARKQMREQRRLAQEKGRVRDVLGGGGVNDLVLGGGEGKIEYTQQSERRLRKVAHRGVVVLFRAVREAQERAAQAERDARKEGVYGVKSREEKVSEMSRQGFLDLIANGGGKLKKKGGLEEA